MGTFRSICFEMDSNEVGGLRSNLQGILKVKRFSGVWCFSENLEKEEFLCERAFGIVMLSQNLYC